MSDYTIVTQKTFKCLVPDRHLKNICWLIRDAWLLHKEYTFSSWKQWCIMVRRPNLELASYPANFPGKWIAAGLKKKKKSPYDSIPKSVKQGELCLSPKRPVEELSRQQYARTPDKQRPQANVGWIESYHFSLPWKSLPLILGFPPIILIYLFCSLDYVD